MYDEDDYDNMSEDEKFRDAIDLLYPNIQSQDELEEVLESRLNRMFD